MAGRRRGSREQREINTFSNRVLRLSGPIVSPSSLLPIEDRRLYNPDPYPPARSFDRSRHRLTVKPPGTVSRLPSAVHFEDPRKVLVCVRRKVRKEVLFSLGRVGKGSGRGKRRRSYFSSISC